MSWQQLVNVSTSADQRCDALRLVLADADFAPNLLLCANPSLLLTSTTLLASFRDCFEAAAGAPRRASLEFLSLSELETGEVFGP